MQDQRSSEIGETSSPDGCRPSYKPLPEFSDDWFVVYQIRRGIFAISEPRYYQGNFSYLVVGERAALVIDAGASHERDITAVIKKLTTKPLSVLPTHLHFDHLGGLARFADVWLADTPALAAFKEGNGLYRVPATYTFGYLEQLGPVVIRAGRLIGIGKPINLGGEVLTPLHAPGHSPDEIVIYDQTANILFTGDYLYPKRLFSSDAGAYAATTEKILALINKDTLLLGAHAHNAMAPEVPAMSWSDLRALKDLFDRMAAGTAQGSRYAEKGSGIASARAYKVNDKISFLENIIWADGTAFRH